MKDAREARFEVPRPPSFWLRLAKGGALVLVGAIAHLWLPSVAQPESGGAPAMDVEQDRGLVPEALAMDATHLGLDATGARRALPGSPPAAAEIVPIPEPEPERVSLAGPAPVRGNVTTGLVPVGTRGVGKPPATPDTSVSDRPGPAVDPAPPAPAQQHSEGEAALVLSEVGARMDIPAALPVTLTRATFVREAPPVAARPLTASPGAAAAALVTLPDQEERIQRVLQAYRTAFEQLDAAAAASVWPTVDVRALGYAFSQLAEQRLRFESCGISVSGDAASARCRGEAEYFPKVGGRRALVTSGEWVFNLARRETDWQIVAANVK